MAGGAGWRSRASTQRLHTRAAEAVVRAPGSEPRPTAPKITAVVAAPTKAPAQQAENLWPATIRPWVGVRFSVPYLMSLLYLFDTTAYMIKQITVVMIVSLLGLFLEPKLVRVPVPLRWFGALVIWGFLIIGSSRDPVLALTSTEDLGKALIITIALVSAIRTRAQVRLAIIIWLAAFAFFPARGGLFNYFIYHNTSFNRVAWSYIFSNPNDLAALCLVPLALCFGLWGAEQRKSPMWWAATTGMLLIPIVMLLTQSRGALIALGVFLVGAFGTQMFRPRSIIVIALGAAAVGLIAPKSVWVRLGGLKAVTNTENLSAVDPEGSAEQRYEIWRVARTIIAEHPLTGVGVGVYPIVHGETANRGGEFKPTARGRRDTHSTYLNILAEVGIPGLLLWAGVIISTFVFADGVRRRLKPVDPKVSDVIRYIELAVFAFLLAGIFGSYWRMSMLYVYLGMLWVVAAAYLPTAQQAAGFRPATR